jgi:adenine-specific DNA-methyltransferase
VLQSPGPKEPGAKKARAKKGTAAKPVASRGGASGEDAQVLSYRHGDRRNNNPEVGMVDPDTDPAQPKTKWAYDPHIDPALQFDIGRAQVAKLIDDALASGDQEVMRRALEQVRRQAAPYLNWTGKAERTSFEVDTVSLHVHERIDPASIINAVRKRTKGEKAAPPMMQLGLFSAPFENLPLRDAIDFYKHDKGWSNRLIAGDSLLVMNSLLQTTLYWGLKYYGYDNLAVLNGGTAQWVLDNRQIQFGKTSPAKGNFKAGAERPAILATTIRCSIWSRGAAQGSNCWMSAARICIGA